MLRNLVFIVPVALAVFALVELTRSTTQERSGLSPWVWAAIIVLLPVIGPVVWLVLSRRAAPGPRTTGPARRPPRRTGPVAPDDDPDFLWRLEQEERRRRRDADPDGSTPPPSDEEPGPTADRP